MPDIANTSVFLVSDQAQMITGVTVDVIAGTTAGINYQVGIPLTRSNKKAHCDEQCASIIIILLLTVLNIQRNRHTQCFRHDTIGFCAFCNFFEFFFRNAVDH